MSPLTRALLLSWDLRPETLAPLVLAGALYLWGWRRLRRRGEGRFACSWRLASYLGGLFALLLALVSPLEVVSAHLFSVHMVQHLLLVMIAPPLLLLANPFPVMLWALPEPWRMRVGKVFRRGQPLHRLLAQTTGPGVVWLFYLLVFFGWHDGNAYSLALRSEAVHILEHVTFFGSGMLFWWHVTGAGPRVHPRPALWVRAAFVLTMVPPNMLLGVFLAFAEGPVFPYYESIPRFYGVSVMDDQTWGGLIMWIPGSMMYVMAALVLVARELMRAENRPTRAGRVHPPVGMDPGRASLGKAV